MHIFKVSTFWVGAVRREHFLNRNRGNFICHRLYSFCFFLWCPKRDGATGKLYHRKDTTHQMHLLWKYVIQYFTWNTLWNVGQLVLGGWFYNLKNFLWSIYSANEVDVTSFKEEKFKVLHYLGILFGKKLTFNLKINHI